MEGAPFFVAPPRDTRALGLAVPSEQAHTAARIVSRRFSDRHQSRRYFHLFVRDVGAHAPTMTGVPAASPPSFDIRHSFDPTL